MSAAAAEGAQRALALGLTVDEYELIVARSAASRPRSSSRCSRCCGRSTAPTSTPSRCCATLPTEGPRLVLGPGENAGAVDVGGGLAVAFKVESHNHPSAVEPFQGAATGVGGILRDIFAVGARPIAILDSLRFGEPTSERSRYLLDRAVAGIGHYGNSIGVPTVGGEVYFEAPYEQNCLINAMCVGLIATERLIRSAASGPGNLLVLFGASTGRDGIGGASVLASAELGEGDEAKRPSVQIGDPFAEKKLMECSLDLLERGPARRAPGPRRGRPDLGGVSRWRARARSGSTSTSPACRCARRGMEPFEIMVSESQERMLCVIEPDALDARARGLRALGDRRGDDRRGHRQRAACGSSTASGWSARCRSRRWSTSARSMSSTRSRRAGRCIRRRRARSPPRIRARRCWRCCARPTSPTAGRCSSSTTAIVQSRTVRRPGAADAAVLALPARGGARARDRDRDRRQRPPRRRRPLPRHDRGVLECAANLACVGAEPLGLTNCLNFGNPEKPHVAWQLTESRARARRRLPRARDPGRRRQRLALQRGRRRPDLPDAGGRPGRRAARRRARAGASASAPRATGSRWSALSRRRSAARSWPRLGGTRAAAGAARDRHRARRASQRAIRDAVRAGALSSAHDIAEGGLATALAECCLAGGLGAEVVLADTVKPLRGAVRRGARGLRGRAAPTRRCASSASTCSW